MQLAVAVLPSAPVLPWQTMASFLDEMVPNAERPGVEPDVAFGVSITSDWQSLTWHVVDERERILGHLGENVQYAGAPASPLLPLIQRSRLSGNSKLGCWCKGATTGLTAGWAMPSHITVDGIVELFPSHPKAGIVRKWAQRVGVSKGRGLTQSYLGAASHTAMLLLMPDRNIAQQWEMIGELFEALSLGNRLRGCFDSTRVQLSSSPPPELFVELSNTGITQIGISFTHPSVSQLRHLQALTPVALGWDESDHNAKLSAFQVMLGATHIDAARCVQDVDGVHWVYTYFPLGDDI